MTEEAKRDSRRGLLLSVVLLLPVLVLCCRINEGRLAARVMVLSASTSEGRLARVVMVDCAGGCCDCGGGNGCSMVV